MFVIGMLILALICGATLIFLNDKYDDRMSRFYTYAGCGICIAAMIELGFFVILKI